MNRLRWLLALGIVVAGAVAPRVCADTFIAEVDVHNDGLAPLSSPMVRAVVPLTKGFAKSLAELQWVAVGMAPLAAVESYVQLEEVTRWDDGSLHTVEVIFKPPVVPGSPSATAPVISTFQIVQKDVPPKQPSLTLTPEVIELLSDPNGVFAVLLDAQDNVYLARLMSATEVTKQGPLLIEAVVHADLLPVAVKGIVPAGPALYHAGMVRLYVNLKKDTSYMDGWLELINGYVDEHPIDKLYFKAFGVCAQQGFIPFINNQQDTAAKNPFLLDTTSTAGNVWCQELIPQPADGTVNLLRDNGVAMFKIAFTHESVAMQALQFLTHEPLGIVSPKGPMNWQTVGYGVFRARLPKLPSAYSFGGAIDSLNTYFNNFLNDTSIYFMEGYLKMAGIKYGGGTGTGDGLSPVQDPTVFATMTGYRPMIEMLLRANVRKMQRMFSWFYHPDGTPWNYHEQTLTDAGGQQYNPVKMTLNSIPNFNDTSGAPDFNRQDLDSEVLNLKAYVAAQGLTPTNEASYLSWDAYDYQHLFRMSGINDAAQLFNETAFKDHACQLATMARALVTELPRKAGANPANPGDGNYNSLWMNTLADTAKYGPGTGVKDSGRGMSESLFWIAACHQYTRDPIQRADLEQYARVVIAAMEQAQIKTGDNGSIFNGGLMKHCLDAQGQSAHACVQTWEDAIGMWTLAGFYHSFGDTADPQDAAFKTSIVNMTVRLAQAFQTPMFFDFQTYTPPHPWGATAVATKEDIYQVYGALVQGEPSDWASQYHRLPFYLYELATGDPWYGDVMQQLTDFNTPITKFFSYWSGLLLGWTFPDWTKQQGLPVIDY